MKRLITIGLFLQCICAILFLASVAGCTLSMQNISTHGTATDLVDENQAATPDIKTDLSIPGNL